MSMNRKLLIAAVWGLVVLALLLLLWVRVLEPRLNQTVADTLGRGDYALPTTDGETFTAASLRGEPTAVFFGFTHCPEVCPTTLGDVAGWQEELAEEDRELKVYFVTVDPERDTLDVLGDYVSWVPGVTGVSGSSEEIDKAIKAFRIYARKVPVDGEGYTMDHSAYVLLFDQKGRFTQPVSYGSDPEDALNKIRALY
ncbi:SCO family protein [Chachezhania antarctica]|uniref:SCO family protein n=1 Tax=Chachezhania antarctica TaxID=2340860 RepID=UPI000EABFF39|nr:SCO family protein [Chachezhania antarctica]|tara:strand:- start:1785 stop:2375 length:591 start_codon:yes stop_codon:yes gene_type:complete